MTLLIIQKLLLGSLIFFSKALLSTASPAALSPRQDLEVDDGSPPRRSFSILLPEPSETAIIVLQPIITQAADDSFLEDDSGMGSGSAQWNSKHTLIISLVICLSSLFFIVMLLYIYSMRRKERLRREQATKRGRAMMASTTESVTNRRPGWGWSTRFGGRGGGDSVGGATRPGTADTGASSLREKMKWGRGAFWEGDAGLVKPGRTAK